jgi:hypothetical protein
LTFSRTTSPPGFATIATLAKIKLAATPPQHSTQVSPGPTRWC